MLSIFSFASASFLASSVIPVLLLSAGSTTIIARATPRSFLKSCSVGVVVLFDFTIADVDLAVVLVLERSDREILARFFAQRLHRHVLRLEALVEVFRGHAAVLFLHGDSVVDLCVSRKNLLSFGALKQHFALDETAEHLQASLGHLQLIQSGRVTAGLLVDLALDLCKHDVAAIDGRGHMLSLVSEPLEDTSTQDEACGRPNK